MQTKHRKLKPGLVASYDIRPGNGNGKGLLWFRSFINLSLTYLTYTLTHLLIAPYGANYCPNIATKARRLTTTGMWLWTQPHNCFTALFPGPSW